MRRVLLAQPKHWSIWQIYEKYKKEADKLTNVYFVGRLANYKYFNMDRPDWDNLSYYCKCGIWDLDAQKERIADESSIRMLNKCIKMIEQLVEIMPPTSQPVQQQVQQVQLLKMTHFFASLIASNWFINFPFVYF